MYHMVHSITMNIANDIEAVVVFACFEVWLPVSHVIHYNASMCPSIRPRCVLTSKQIVSAHSILQAK